MCSAISFPVAAFIAIKNSFTMCPSFNLKALERELLYEIWPYRGSFIIWPSAYNPIYSLSNASCIKLHLYIAVRQYGTFGPQFCSMNSVSFSQCLTSVYEAWSCFLDVWSLILFATQRIPTVTVVFANSRMLPLAFLPVRSPRSVTGRILLHLPFFLASWTLLAHRLKIISTHCRRIHSALFKLSNGSKVSKVSKKSAPVIAQCSGLSRSCFKPFCPPKMDPSFFPRNPATHTFFHLLKALKLGCPILLPNCLMENFVSFKLIGTLHAAPPKSDQSSLS